MARREDLLELLRPPAHRGPLIAAGAVVFTLGVWLEEQRLDDALPLGVHLLILALSAGLILGLGLQAGLEDGRPAAYQSVLLVAGLLLLEAALLTLADGLGADFSGDLPSGAIVWTSLLLGAAALHPAVRRNSAVCGMIAALAAGAAVLAAVDWIFGPGTQTPYRWVLLALALAFALGSLVVRESRPRHAEMLVITAGLATLAIPIVAGLSALLGVLATFGAGGDDGFLPGFWELVVLVAGCGLIAYGAVDRVPGAAWLGGAHLVAFLLAASAGAEETLLWWPLTLLLLGGGAMAVGLRPRAPLPPEPDGYSVERPLASRTEEETVVRVRDDRPPSR